MARELPPVAVVEADMAHVRYVAERMRAADVAECDATSGRSPIEALTLAYQASPLRWTGLVDGEPVCIFGCAGTLLGNRGSPWLLGTDKLLDHQWAFLRRSRRWLSPMAGRYAVLENYVDARNAASIRWLRWLGFTLHSPEPWGVRGLPFHRFTIGGDDV